MFHHQDNAVRMGKSRPHRLGAESDHVSLDWVEDALCGASSGCFCFCLIAIYFLTVTSGIRNLLPAFFHEMGADGILSDATMQSMQQFFDVDFHHYAVDRAALSTSRTRAQLMSVFERKLRQATIDALSRELATENDVDLRPVQAKLDKNGLGICSCGGRHYVNTDAGWEKHITYKKHRCGRVALFYFPNP